MLVDLRKPKDRKKIHDRSWSGILTKRDGREVCATKASWARRREELYELSKSGTFVACFFCGSHVSWEHYHCHHINGTRGLGGGKRDDRLANLAVAHEACHQLHHRDPRYFERVGKESEKVPFSNTVLTLNQTRHSSSMQLGNGQELPMEVKNDVILNALVIACEDLVTLTGDYADIEDLKAKTLLLCRKLIRKAGEEAGWEVRDVSS